MTRTSCVALAAALALTCPASATDPDGRLAEPTGPLPLAAVMPLVLQGSPGLASFAWEVRARDAHAVQEGRPPNPALRAEVENVGGSGRRQDFEDTETTISLAQLIELGGKRQKRRRLAELGAALAGWDYETKRAQVLADATRAFVRTLAAQQRLALAAELEELASRTLRGTTAQVDAGAATPVEATRADVARGKAGLGRIHAEEELAAARTALAATWGGERATFARAVGDLDAIAAPPPVDELARRLAMAPDLARWPTELEEKDAALALARAARVPDVTVGAGGRHFSDTGDNAIVFELSVPLPVFDRNDGGIAEAGHRAAKAGAEWSATRVGLQADLSAAAARASAAHRQAVRMREHVLPLARRSLDGAHAAYGTGALRAVDVLDAQRTLSELRAEYVDVLERYHLAVIDVERLTAMPLVGRSEGDAR
jgi:cobalt-zinc-cadmium efflux system outer membrane protein